MSGSQHNLLNCYKILELPEDASWAEIKKSYCNLRELYSVPSLATLSINEDLLGEHGAEILEQIDNAYRVLRKHFEEIWLKNEKKIERIISKVGLFDGHTLKQVRETLNIDLLDIAMATNIQINHLKNIENEHYQALPNDVYLRGYLVSYAEFVSLDPKRVVDEYMAGYKKWRKETLS